MGRLHRTAAHKLITALSVGRMMAGAKPQVIHLTGPVILDWENGVRIQLSPAGITTAPTPVPAARRGRKPSPATQALIAAMQQDASAGKQQSRGEYVQLLKSAGHGSATTAGIIVTREAKRIFGGPLMRKATAPARKGRRGPRSPATDMLRGKLAADKAAGKLRDAAYYIRWLVDQDKLKLGLKAARPIAYRELRAAR